MRIYFDVDDTLITWDVRLRPDVHDVFRKLREDGHDVYLWSGYGPRWEVVRRWDLHELVLDCFWKPLYNHHARLEELGVPCPPDFAVDDHPEIIEVFGGTVVKAAGGYGEDREMWRVYHEITAFHSARQGAAAEPGEG